MRSSSSHKAFSVVVCIGAEVLVKEAATRPEEVREVLYAGTALEVEGSGLEAKIEEVRGTTVVEGVVAGSLV